jgi:hypothetical protein
MWVCLGTWELKRTSKYVCAIETGEGGGGRLYGVYGEGMDGWMGIACISREGGIEIDDVHVEFDG